MGIEIVFISNLGEVTKAIDNTIKERMSEAVQSVRSEVLQTLTGPRSGRTYKVPGTQRTYTASAPGQPPAQVTGELRQSISSEVEGEGKKIVGRVGSDKKKAPMLEFGTKNMAPRPFLRPTFEKTAGKVKEIFIRRWF